MLTRGLRLSLSSWRRGSSSTKNQARVREVSGCRTRPVLDGEVVISRIGAEATVSVEGSAGFIPQLGSRNHQMITTGKKFRCGPCRIELPESKLCATARGWWLPDFDVDGLAISNRQISNKCIVSCLPKQSKEIAVDHRRSTSLTLAGVTTAALLFMPGQASADVCSFDGSVNLAQLDAGCTYEAGTLVTLDDGTEIALPAPGETVVAMGVPPAGMEGLEVALTNAGATGVAVQLEDEWRGAPVAVEEQQEALAGRTATNDDGSSSRASCGSSECNVSGWRWPSDVVWRYNSSGQIVSGASALSAAASAWSGTVTTCGYTILSSAGHNYIGTTTTAPNIISGSGG